MVKRTHFEFHLALSDCDPATEFEERQQARPSTVVIAVTKIVISHPHSQVREPYLKKGHELVRARDPPRTYPAPGSVNLRGVSALVAVPGNTPHICPSGEASAAHSFPVWFCPVVLPTRLLLAGL